MSRKQSPEKRRRALGLLVRTAAAHRGTLIAGCLATVGVVAMRLALPWPLRGVVENVFPAAADAAMPTFGFARPVLAFCAMYFVLALGSGLFEGMQRVWMARVASRIAHDLRTRAVASIGPAERRSAAGSADLITRVVGDVARMRADIKGILIHLGQNGLLLLAITCLFLYLAPKLGLLFLLGGVLAILIGYTTVDEVAETTARHRSKESRYAASIQDEIDADETAEAISRSSTKKDVRTTRIIARSSMMVHAAVAATIAFALWVGVSDVRAGRLAPGELFLFIAYAITIQRRAVMIGRQIARGGKLLANTDRLRKMIDSGQEPAVDPAELHDVLRLEGVRLKRSPILAKRARFGPVNLAVSRGEKVLVLGGPGSGKTRLLMLLAGRLDARQGRVFWDEIDLTEKTASIRAAVAYISDEPEFGRLAIRRALGLREGYQPGADEVSVLETIGVWSLVRRARAGLDEQISSAMLSPTERRALVLGRALLGKADVWVLDNPIDTDRPRDRKRLAAILDRAENRTTIVSLRRRSLVERFDRVIVMRRGRIDFDGTPAEWKHRRDQLRVIRGA